MSTEDYRKLSKTEVRSQIKELNSWRVVAGKLHREMEFRTFEDAIAFMMRTSLEISKLDHHPEWFNVYNRIKIDLVTHDVGGISQYDFLLAKKIEAIGRSFKVR